MSKFWPTKRSPVLTVVGLVLCAALATSALAQDRRDARGQRLELDSRYHHDRYYPARGSMAPRLPVGSTSVAFGGGHFFFNAGVWYRPVGAGFEVITPPFGIVVPVLPPGFVSVTLGGAPYFYANGVYYTQAPGVGYTVVAPPPGAEPAPVAEAEPPMAAPVPDPMPSRIVAPAREPVIYPRNGQSAAQTEADHQQCRQWADAQPAAANDGSVYERALAACLDGRGYTIR
jgi:Family of unknown function (DUF6515)